MKLEATVFALATAIAIDDDSGTAALGAIDIVHGLLFLYVVYLVGVAIFYDGQEHVVFLFFVL